MQKIVEKERYLESEVCLQHGSSSRIRNQMSNKAHSQTVRCYDKHIESKIYEIY